MAKTSLVHYREILRIAAARNTLAATFDCAEGHLEIFEAVLEASKRHEAPAIFLVWGGFTKSMGFKGLVQLVDAMASRVGVPATLHLDHSHDENEIKEAIKAGFTSVMFDVEKFGIDEGIRKTRTLVAWAHSKGAIVESSFSKIGREHADGTPDDMEITDVADAVRFVEETGTDMLCPAVGNQHGVTTRTMPLNWSLMESLHAKVTIPMVLHGGSGIAIEDLARAASLGFRKVNLFTKLHALYSEAQRNYIQQHPKDGWMKWVAPGRKAVEDFVEKYLAGLHWDGAVSDLAK